MDKVRLEFDAYIETKKVSKGQAFTHTRVGYPAGSYYIEDGIDNQRFIELYIKMIYAGATLNFSEKQREIGPLMTDYDLEFIPTEENTERQYSIKDVRKICKIINILIHKYICVDKKDIKAYITEKKKPTIKYNNDRTPKLVKDGFHICYFLPFTIEQRKFLYKKLVKYVKDKNVLGNIPFSNTYESIIDEATIERNNWMMYKSVKTLNGIPSHMYELTHIFDFHAEECDDELDDDELINLFSVRQYTDDDKLDFNEEYRELIQLTEYKQTDQIPNMYYNNQVRNMSPSNIDRIAQPNIYSLNNEQVSITKNNGLKFVNRKEKNRFLAKELLKLFNISRCNNYEDWIKIGWALKSVNENMLDVFKEYSTQSPKYKAGSCERMWENARKSGNFITLKTLKHFASIDNRREYNKLIQSLESEEFTQALTGNDEDLAVYIHSKYEHKFICSSIEHNAWYVFRNHRWAVSEDATHLRKKIASEIAQEFVDKSHEPVFSTKEQQDHYLKKKNKYEKKIHEFDNCLVSDPDFDNSVKEAKIYRKKLDDMINKNKKDEDKKRGKFIEIAKKLKNNSSIKGVISSCAHQFFNSDFENLLNSNRNLVGFNNGIYDLKERKFRAGIPEDYLSFSTGYNYEEYTGNEQVFEDINKYFYMLQVQPDIREYLLKYTASCLEGGNKDQVFMCWTGSGSNGKSMYTKLLQKVFGDYYASVEHTIITRKRGNSSSASPELVDIKGKRLVVLQEPEESDKIHASFMKQITGEDEINARALYRNGIKYTPQFKIVLVCNALPTIDVTDNGTWRRVRVTPFDSEFLHNLPLHHLPTQFKMNKNMENVVYANDWNAPLIWLLINKYYVDYDENGIIEPEEVILNTNSYRNNSDIYNAFLTANYIIMVDGETKDLLTLKDVYADFKEWYSGSNPQQKIPNKIKLKEYFIKSTKVKVNSNEELRNIKKKNAPVDVNY